MSRIVDTCFCSAIGHNVTGLFCYGAYAVNCSGGDDVTLTICSAPMRCYGGYCINDAPAPGISPWLFLPLMPVVIGIVVMLFLFYYPLKLRCPLKRKETTAAAVTESTLLLPK